MKLHAQTSAGQNTITAYGPDHVTVNGEVLRTSLIVTPDAAPQPWRPASIDELLATDMEVVATLDCPVVILGTGARQQFPKPAVLRPLIERGIGVEVMDNGAACRTFNILVAEGRAVAAAILIAAPAT